MKQSLKSFKLLVLIFSIFAFYSSYVTAFEFDHSHQEFDQILKEYVKDDLVNYKAIRKQPEALNSYIDLLSKVDESIFNKWSKDEQLAYLINLYNAVTIELVADNYPVKSIKDIDKEGEGPWKLKVVNLFSEKISLDSLEHEIIRKDYNEPRIHFALVCAAIGCPKIPNKSFIASKLDQQLDERARLFLSEKDINFIDKDQKVIYLSPIFDWFMDDFKRNSNSVISYIQNYFPRSDIRNIDLSRFKIKYTEYDWGLNDIKS